MNEGSPEDASARVRAIFGDNVDVQPLHIEPETTQDIEQEVVDLITRVCYFYPQYKVEDALLLPDSMVTALLLQAEKQRAIEFYNQTLIAAAPHTKKGKLVDKLIKQYKKITEL